MRRLCVTVVSLLCLVGCTSEGSDRSQKPTGGPDRDPFECSESNDDGAGTDLVTLRDEGWTVFDSVLEGYQSVNYAATFDSNPDVAVDGVTVRVTFLDSSGDEIESESDPDGALMELTSPGADGVLAASDSVRLADEPNSAELEFTDVCWRPSDSDHYGTVEVSNSKLATNNGESSVDVQLESSIELEATGTIFFIFRNEDDEIIGGTTDTWPQNSVAGVEPGESEVTMTWEWEDDSISADEIFPDQDSVATAEAHLMLQVGRAHTQ